MSKTLRIGMLGLGTVGQGVVRSIRQREPSLEQKTGYRFELVRVAVRAPDKKRDVPVDPSLLTSDAMSVCTDPDVDVVVELIGGTSPARELVLAALAGGKPVVTANKALLALHGPEIFAQAKQAGTSVSFEASTGAGIPIISALRDGLVSNRIESIFGIVNGTANFVLTRMLDDNMRFADAVSLAQQKGYAEADPATDIEGIDAAHKLALLANLGFHTVVDFQKIYVEGITRIRLTDVRYAQEMGYVVKLLAIAKNGPGGMELRVHPTLLRNTHPLAAVSGVYNGILVVGDAVGQGMFYGRGAGQMPTASAIVADLVDGARGTAAQTFGKLQFFQKPHDELPVVPINRVETRYFVRVTCEDKPGVFARIASALGDNQVSIASVIQKEPADGAVPVVILTHKTREENFRRARERIGREPFVTEPSAFIRVEAEE